MKQNKWLKGLSCSVFAGLYLIVAIISLICSTEFFKLAHSGIMSWVLAIGFEVGAMSCLLSTLILPKKKLGLVWFMFIILTLFQCMGNMYAAFVHLENYTDWIDMFGISDLEQIAQKRVLSAISGIILPLVALGFIRIMADVIQDGHDIEINDNMDTVNQNQSIIQQEHKTVDTGNQNDVNDNNTDIITDNTDSSSDKVIEKDNNMESFVEDYTVDKSSMEQHNSENQVIEEPVIEKTIDKPIVSNTAQTEDNNIKKTEKNTTSERIWNQKLNAELG